MRIISYWKRWLIDLLCVCACALVNFTRLIQTVDNVCSTLIWAGRFRDSNSWVSKQVWSSQQELLMRCMSVNQMLPAVHSAVFSPLCLRTTVILCDGPIGPCLVYSLPDVMDWNMVWSDFSSCHVDILLSQCWCICVVLSKKKFDIWENTLICFLVDSQMRRSQPVCWA